MLDHFVFFVLLTTVNMLWLNQDTKSMETAKAFQVLLYGVIMLCLQVYFLALFVYDIVSRFIK